MNLRPPSARAASVTALIALCAVLGGVIYSELSAPIEGAASTASPAPAASKPLAAGEPDGFTPPAAQAYSEISERPLFSASRRPAPRQSSPEAIGAVSSFVFAGSIISKTERVALVQHSQPVKLVRLREGDSLEGWTVVAIEADRVILEHNGDREELKPRDKVSPTAPRPFPAPGTTSAGRRLDPS